MSTQRLRIPYQSQTIEVDVASEQLLGIIDAAPDLPSVTDLEAEARQALRSPIGSRRIPERVASDSTVGVLVDDWTRPTPAHRLAPLVLEEFVSAGIKERNIFFLYATGQHPASREQAVAKIGRTLADRFEVVVHNPKDLEGLIFLGFTSTGTPVWVNRAVERADFLIGIGGIKPNFSPGWSGGCKIVMPGISGWETVNHTHVKVMAGNRVNSLGVDDSPVRQDIEEIGDMAGLSFILNVVWNRSGQVSGVVAGDPHQAWRKGLEAAKKSFLYKVPARADIAIIGAGRAEHISSALFTATKGFYLTKEGGTIILVAPCTKGWASEEALRIPWFMSAPEDWAHYTASEIMWKALRRELDPVRTTNGVYSFRLTAEKRHVIVVSHGLAPEKAKAYGLDHSPSLGEALTKAYVRQGRGARIIAMPRENEFVPID